MIRRRLLVVVLSAVAASLTALVIGFNVILAHTLDGNARSVLRSRAAAQLDVIDTSSGHIRLREGSNAVPDTGVWVLEGNRVIERPRARRLVDAEALLAAAGPAGFRSVGDADVWLYTRPVLASSSLCRALPTSRPGGQPSSRRSSSGSSCSAWSQLPHGGCSLRRCAR